MLSALRSRALEAWAEEPRCDTVAAARVLLLLPVVAVLLLHSTVELVAPLSGHQAEAEALPSWQTDACRSWVGLTALCLVPAPHLDGARFVLAAVLLISASGWRIRWSALPAWWVTWSLLVTSRVREGSDALVEILLLLLLPTALADRRRWAWRRSALPSTLSPTAHLLARYGLALVSLQVAVLYAWSVISKLGQASWRDGTAMRFWATDPTWGFRGGPGLPLLPLLRTDAGAALLTWAPLVAESLVVVALFVRRPRRRLLVLPAALLHVGIALTMGLTGFAVVMLGALLLLAGPLPLVTGVGSGQGEADRQRRPPQLARGDTMRIARLTLAAEAAAALVRASLVVRLSAEPRLVARLGSALEAPEPRSSAATADDATADDAIRVGRAVRGAARRLPWRPMCLPQALAAQQLLHRRRLPQELHLGARTSPQLEAHAWVTSGGHPVVGGDGRGYACLGTWSKPDRRAR